MTGPTHLFAAAGYDHPYRSIPRPTSTTDNKENNQ